jgi:hypothetical protein
MATRKFALLDGGGIAPPVEDATLGSLRRRHAIVSALAQSLNRFRHSVGIHNTTRAINIARRLCPSLMSKAPYVIESALALYP